MRAKYELRRTDSCERDGAQLRRRMDNCRGRRMPASLRGRVRAEQVAKRIGKRLGDRRCDSGLQTAPTRSPRTRLNFRGAPNSPSPDPPWLTLRGMCVHVYIFQYEIQASVLSRVR